MLTEEDRQQIFDAIGGNEEADVNQEALDGQAVDAESAPVEFDDHASDSEEGEEEDHPHSIPYNRFREVNEERKEYRSLVEDQDARIAELEESLERLMQGAGTQQDEENVVSAFEGHDDDIDWEGFRSGVMSEMEDLRISNAEVELERDISIAMEEFPDVPPEAILQAIANDGTVDVFEFAEDYQEFVTEIREGAIADYVKGNGSRSSARPRVASAGSTTGGNTSRPQTMEAAQAALLRHLKEM